jgi:hypothetical protein
MISRKAFASLIGFAGILCSVTFFVGACVNAVPYLSFGGMLTFGTLGIVLPLIAAKLGSRLWAWAALLPVISVIIGFVLYPPII